MAEKNYVNIVDWSQADIGPRRILIWLVAEI
jgi:hypothetical protein